jgi:hypothetical protein
MAVFDIEENEGSWFDIEGGGRVKLRPITNKEWREIVKATVKKGPPEYPLLDGKHQRFQPDIVDADLQLELLWDKTIVEWEGLNDKNGNPLPCNLEWKINLMYMKSDTFRDFYNEKMKVMADIKTEQGAVAEKN